MELEVLRQKFIDEISSCFMAEKGNIYEFKIFMVNSSEKDISEIKENPKNKEMAFFVGLENPNDKKIWYPCYAQPVIVVNGIENNGKLILADFKKGGYDVPDAWFTIEGNFFLTKEDAELYLSTLTQKAEIPKTKEDVIKDLREIIVFAHNFVDSEAADLFEEKIEDVISSIESMK